MSILQTDIEKFENLFEGMNTKPSKPMMESVIVSNTRKALEEAESKKKKEDKKKKTADSKKKSSIVKAKKNLSILSEAFAKDTIETGLDTEAKKKFFEALVSAESCLLEMAQEIGNDFERYYELLQKYYKTGDLTPEEADFLNANDPEKELDDKIDAFNVYKKHGGEMDSPKTSNNPNV